MKSYGKDIPYVKFKANLKKLPIGEISDNFSRKTTKKEMIKSLFPQTKKTDTHNLSQTNF